MNASLLQGLSTFLLLLLAAGCGPIGPFSGGALRGDVHVGPPPLDAIGAEETVQLETSPAEPHSVNVWIAEVDGGLYLATSLILGADDPKERDWVKNVERDANVRLRADGVVYLLRAARVESEPERTRAFDALVSKYDVEVDDHARGAWIYRLDPR